MATVRVHAERVVDVPAETVYAVLRDMEQHHPHILPPAFAGFTVESGGVGAGTVVRFTFTAGGRTRSYRMTVAEPEPGRVMTETDTDSSLVTTFTVTPQGTASRVCIDTEWAGAGGVGGFFERTFAPRALQRIYADELQRLETYAAGLARGGGAAGS